MNNKEEGSRPEKDTALKEEAKKKLISVSCQLHTEGRPDIEQHPDKMDANFEVNYFGA